MALALINSICPFILYKGVLYRAHPYLLMIKFSRKWHTINKFLMIEIDIFFVVFQLISILLKKFCMTDHPNKFQLFEEYKADGRADGMCSVTSAV